ISLPPRSTLFPYTTLFRSQLKPRKAGMAIVAVEDGHVTSQRPGSKGGHNLKRLARLPARCRYMTNHRMICLALPQPTEVHLHVSELVKINTQSASFVSPAEAVHSHP